MIIFVEHYQMTVSEQIKNHDKVFTFHTVLGLVNERVRYSYILCWDNPRF